ncbi:MAG: hypothetical protein KJ558_04975 [Gammaproteobacteria bacterium]|nr:hypothetical protein [Gammaproteobacteria bacterium]MBU1654172.1 hypothetical protein [Gammaproteobacteria bacterium]MBU1961826.1 hypothetical protein [Gammaproteobacteria bacterium]
MEHRLFSQISRNWAGHPLRTLATMLGFICGTSTAKGAPGDDRTGYRNLRKGNRS